MLGYEVNKTILDARFAETAIAIRQAFADVETMAKWLANHPGSGANDPLVTSFGYTEDEAYVVRVYFETLETVRGNNTATFDLGRKMTGLE